MGGRVVQQYHVSERKIYHCTWLEVQPGLPMLLNFAPKTFHLSIRFATLTRYLEVKETNFLQTVCRLSEGEKKIGYLPDEERGNSDSNWKIDNSGFLS